ncbi:hypothetical protein GCM10027059_48390 [Myceligenerans halotolerans]
MDEYATHLAVPRTLTVSLRDTTVHRLTSVLRLARAEARKAGVPEQAGFTVATDLTVAYDSRRYDHHVTYTWTDEIDLHEEV